MHDFKKTKKIRAIFTWAVLVALLLPLCQAYAAGRNTLTLYRYTQGAALHAINEKPEGGTPVAGSVFTLWKVSVDSRGLSAEEYSEKIDALQEKTPAELTKLYGTPITSEATDANGQTKVSALEDGLYYVREVDAGKGTIVPLLVPLPLLTEQGAEADVRVYPKILQPTEEPGELLLRKVDPAGKPLSDAEFRLYREMPAVLEEVPLTKDAEGYQYNGNGKGLLLVSGEDGQVRVTNLPKGSYTLREIKAPAGYVADGQSVSVRVESGQISTYTITNTPRETGGFRFQKISADGKKTPLQGAAFAVYQKTQQGWELLKEDGKTLELTSGADGFFEITGLSFGDYALYEIRRPEGYEFSDRPIYFTVDEKSYDEGKFIPIENRETPPNTPPDNPPSRPPQAPPQTGDAGIAPYVVGGGIAFVGILLLAFLKRRKRDQK